MIWRCHIENASVYKQQNDAIVSPEETMTCITSLLIESNGFASMEDGLKILEEK